MQPHRIPVCSLLQLKRPPLEPPNEVRVAALVDQCVAEIEERVKKQKMRQPVVCVEPHSPCLDEGEPWQVLHRRPPRREPG